MKHAYNGYRRLCLFGLGMAVYYGSPWWVWVIGALCAVQVKYTTKH